MAITEMIEMANSTTRTRIVGFRCPLDVYERELEKLGKGAMSRHIVGCLTGVKHDGSMVDNAFLELFNMLGNKDPGLAKDLFNALNAEKRGVLLEFLESHKE